MAKGVGNYSSRLPSSSITFTFHYPSHSLLCGIAREEGLIGEGKC